MGDVTQLYAADLDGEQTKQGAGAVRERAGRRRWSFRHSPPAACTNCTQRPLQHREHARELLNSTIASRCSTEKLRYCVCAHHGSCNGEVNRCKMTGGLLKRYKQASGEGRRPRAAERAPGADHRGQSSNCRPAKAAARSCRAAAKLSAHCSVI